jgi:hypothetical protein
MVWERSWFGLTIGAAGYEPDPDQKSYVRKVIAADNSPSSDHLLHAQIEGMDIEVLANLNKERRGLSDLFPKRITRRLYAPTLGSFVET